MKYETVIGLEVHVELSTKSKIFCGCSTTFGAPVNTQCCPICIGMPGTLPVLNEKVVEYATRVGLATNCTITSFSKQDRKNYFYPDLPKAYQISQYELPLCKDGYLAIDDESESEKIVGITRIHIEEDAGKLIHDERGGSLIDFNRCGIPLIEIVSEPHMRSAGEARRYVEKLRNIILYVGASDCKMQEGSMRVDVNLSVRPLRSEAFGTRTEMKNLNSFRSIERAISAESKRQVRLLEQGKKVMQETRRWNDEKGVSESMRSKEEAHDYRYFPDPDLPPLHIAPSYVQTVKDDLPVLPEERMRMYRTKWDLPEYDAKILTGSKVLADFFECATAVCQNPKSVSNWIMVELMRMLKQEGMEPQDMILDPKHFGSLVELVEKGVITANMGKKVFEIIFKSNEDPKKVIDKLDLAVVSDESKLLGIVEEVIKENTKSVEDYRAGKKKAFGHLMGQVMAKTKGKADPQTIKKLLTNELQSEEPT